MTPGELAALRKLFPITENAIYLDHAAVGPISNGVRSGIRRQADLHIQEIVKNRPEFGERYAATRAALARLTGSHPESIAYVQNTSHGLSQIANGQNWKSGDNVIVPAMEFPSNYLPWLRLEGHGVEMRRVHAPEGRITSAAIAELIDRKTRVVALSAVQYYNGYRADLAAIAEVVREHDALLIVDGTQAVGAVCLDVNLMGIDALVVSTHKWMLGPLGIGFMCLSKRALERTEVTELGWLSVNDPFAFRREIDLPPGADRFETGTENAAGLFGLSERVSEIEEFGASRIQARVLHLTSYLREILCRDGHVVTSPAADGEMSGILTFNHASIDLETVVDELRSDSVYLSARNGNFRVSPHYYNSENELEEVADRIKQFLS